MNIKDMVEKYTYRVEWSAEDNTHIARCLEFPSLLAHGKSAVAALKEIEKTITASLIWMVQENEEIPVPIGTRKYKGNLTLRVPPAIHKKLAIQSAEQGVSINQLILSKL